MVVSGGTVGEAGGGEKAAGKSETAERRIQTRSWEAGEAREREKKDKTETKGILPVHCLG